MDKIRFTLCVVLLVSMIGCQQREEQLAPLHGNCLIAETANTKTSNSYVCFVLVGHEAKGCPGCTMIGGRLMHVPCHSHGKVCQKSSSMTLQSFDGSITATTTDTFGLTSDDFFNMPDRSLSYTDENNNRIYLNIPEQLVFRDTVTQQFTFTGLFFSEDAVYTND